jgi:hypothetical protein
MGEAVYLHKPMLAECRWSTSSNGTQRALPPGAPGLQEGGKTLDDPRVVHTFDFVEAIPACEEKLAAYALRTGTRRSSRRSTASSIALRAGIERCFEE